MVFLESKSEVTTKTSARASRLHVSFEGPRRSSFAVRYFSLVCRVTRTPWRRRATQVSHSASVGRRALHLEDAVDGREGSGLEGGAADEEAVDVGSRGKGGGVLVVGRAAILDADRVGDRGGDLVGDPGPDLGVRLLGLLGRRGEARADGPHRLVGDHEVREVGRGVGADRLELRDEDVHRRARFALLLVLAAARDDLEPERERLGDLLAEERVGLAKDVAALRVPDDHRRDAEIRQHLARDLARERSFRLLVHVLRGDLERGVHGGLDGFQVHVRHAQKDLALGLGRRVEPLHELHHRRLGRPVPGVHLPVPCLRVLSGGTMPPPHATTL
mmetsp:Transcript_10753/g.43507  ORF Transcript_10753/g.43507 Transcript_10753/m.43507 type:complete len:331 (+) Transcript_10753:158-1150(+)